MGTRNVFFRVSTYTQVDTQLLIKYNYDYLPILSVQVGTEKFLLHPVYRDDTDENIKSWNERGGWGGGND